MSIANDYEEMYEKAKEIAKQEVGYEEYADSPIDLNSADFKAIVKRHLDTMVVLYTETVRTSYADTL